MHQHPEPDDYYQEPERFTWIGWVPVAVMVSLPALVALWLILK